MNSIRDYKLSRPSAQSLPLQPLRGLNDSEFWYQHKQWLGAQFLDTCAALTADRQPYEAAKYRQMKLTVTTLTAKQITPRVTDEYGEVRWDAILHNQNDEIVAAYDVLTLVTKPWPQTNES